MLTRKEKEELVIKLLQEGKTYKEIAKEAHVSLTLIGLYKKEN
jgi:DNA-binding NarL/FixJ family response regulator